jgi:hypothetical protein
MKPKIFTFTALLLLAAGSFYTCTEKNQAEPFLTVDETPVTVNTDAGNYSIAVSSNGEWTAVVEDAANNEWCTLTNTSGNGSGTITVNVAENTATTPRSATVKITLGRLTKSIVINQDAAEEQDEPFLSVDETTITAEAAAGTYAIAVISNDEWIAVVEDAANHEWCTLTNASGANNGTVTVTITENIDITPRSATMNITSGSLIKSVTINQEAIDENAIRACGVTDPAKNLPWLAELIEKAETGEPEDLIAVIWLEQYNGQDLFVVVFPLSSTAYHVFDCEGNRVSGLGADFYNHLKKNVIIYVHLNYSI